MDFLPEINHGRKPSVCTRYCVSRVTPYSSARGTCRLEAFHCCMEWQILVNLWWSTHIIESRIAIYWAFWFFKRFGRWICNITGDSFWKPYVGYRTRKFDISHSVSPNPGIGKLDSAMLAKIEIFPFVIDRSVISTSTDSALYGPEYPFTKWAISLWFMSLVMQRVRLIDLPNDVSIR